jgi:hypothetical protein
VERAGKFLTAVTYFRAKRLYSMSDILDESLQRRWTGAAKSKIGVSVRNFLLAVLLLSQVGCASTSSDSPDGSSDYNQPKNDDSNGWGTGFKVGH